MEQKKYEQLCLSNKKIRSDLFSETFAAKTSKGGTICDISIKHIHLPLSEPAMAELMIAHRNLITVADTLNAVKEYAACMVNDANISIYLKQQNVSSMVQYLKRDLYANSDTNSTDIYLVTDKITPFFEKYSKEQITHRVVLDCMRRLAAMIRDLHSADVLHRAIHPNCIWFDTSNKMMLGGFDYSCALDVKESKPISKPYLTRAHMPESTKNGQLGSKADDYNSIISILRSIYAGKGGVEEADPNESYESVPDEIFPLLNLHWEANTEVNIFKVLRDMLGDAKTGLEQSGRLDDVVNTKIIAVDQCDNEEAILIAEEEDVETIDIKDISEDDYEFEESENEDEVELESKPKKIKKEKTKKEKAPRNPEGKKGKLLLIVAAILLISSGIAIGVVGIPLIQSYFDKTPIQAEEQLPVVENVQEPVEDELSDSQTEDNGGDQEGQAESVDETTQQAEGDNQAGVTQPVTSQTQSTASNPSTSTQKTPATSTSTQSSTPAKRPAATTPTTPTTTTTPTPAPTPTPTPSTPNITLSASSVVLEEGDTKTVSSNVGGSWSSSNSSVATVSGGTISAKSPGSCTVTCSSGGKSATVYVTVT